MAMDRGVHVAQKKTVSLVNGLIDLEILGSVACTLQKAKSSICIKMQLKFLWGIGLIVD